jgi:hypothetical protein
MITYDELRRILHYNPDTGIFIWLIDCGSRCPKKGDQAGGRHNKGYVQIKIDGHSYLAHRLAWLYMTGEWPPYTVDHENRNRSDNHWSNLRPANMKDQNGNQSPHRNNTSGYRGVTWNKFHQKWQAQLQISKNKRHLGYFIDKEQAYNFVRLAAIQYFGEFYSG